MSWCGLDLIFDLTVVTLTFKIFSELYLRNCEVLKVDTWQEHSLGDVGVQCHGVTVI